MLRQAIFLRGALVAIYLFIGPGGLGAAVAQVATNSAPASGITATIPDDLNLLVGKRVVVGRLALCTPKTYAVNLSYSGKEAKIVSFSRNQSLDGIRRSISSLPIETQSLMQDMMKGGLILFEFDDGSQLDSCASLGWKALSTQLDLSPGESISTLTSGQAAPPELPPLPPASVPGIAPTICPISIVSIKSGVGLAHMLADSLTTSTFQRQLDEASHNGQSKHYLDVRVVNRGGKPISAFEFGSVYMNKMGDPASSSMNVSQNARPIGPGEEATSWTMDRDNLQSSGAGEVKVFISRVRFNDGTSWQDDGTHPCSRSTKIG